ncbi:MAG: glycosyltransferase, partial [Clostridia bacterium]|nr:glycosyltransferase [Clostridia bacterium]
MGKTVGGMLRILFTNNAPIIRAGLAPATAGLGCDVRVLNTWEQRDPAAFLRAHVRDFRPDAVVTEGWPGFGPEVVAEALAGEAVPHVYWAIEDPVAWGWISRPWALVSRYVFTLDAATLPRYRDLGRPAEVMLHACNPAIHRPVPPVAAYRHDIVLVAYNSEERQHLARMLLEPLLRRGHDVFVWGGLWQDPSRWFRLPPDRCGGILPFEAIPAVYSSARIVLGIHHVVDSPTQTSMRTFEALGCRAFYLTHYTLAHANLFRNGEHLVWVRDEAEVVAAVERYLRDDAARAAVAAAGLA